MSNHWEDDILNREDIAKFLTKLTLRKYENQYQAGTLGAMCIALDADWGAGKTFFANRWLKDLENCQHPVIYFDAWRNDLSDDPLIGFMSELNNSLKPLVERLPPAAQARNDAGEKLKDVINAAPRAILAAGAVIAKGLIKKGTGVAIDQVLESFNREDEEGESDRKISSESIDAFFSTALAAHSSRQEAIGNLKQKIRDLLQYLNRISSTNLPMYIFLDELDRCRPDYAVRLLEGIKHIFDVSDICFVISTNLQQLSSAAQAIYGQNFDGRGYLSRFFTMQITLPEPDLGAYAELLTKQYGNTLERLDIQSGIPREENEQSSDMIAKNFHRVAEIFKLDLRSLNKVFLHAEAATAGMTDGETLHCFYLFFLAAAFYKNPQDFSMYKPGTTLNLDSIRPYTNDAKVKYLVRNHEGRGFDKKQLDLRTIALKYHDLSVKTPQQVEDLFAKLNSHTYPEGITVAVYKECQSFTRNSNKTPLSTYYHKILTAGQVIKLIE